MSRLSRYFILSSGVILFITAVAKIISVCGSARVLLVSDPLIGLSFRWLFLIVGAAELVLACLCLFTSNVRLNCMLIAWLSTALAVYRFGLWWMNWQRPCHCLGNLTDALHISPQIADGVMLVVLTYLLAGSYASLFGFWLRSQKAVEAR